MAIKRLHYFDHQFLVAADFTDEQKYHLDMRRRLNRLLHTFGIAEGLGVAKSTNKTVTVRSGTAIDNFGREMIVEADQVVDLSNAVKFPANATVFITIKYQYPEQESDQTTATGASGYTRVTEQATVEAVTTAPPADGTVIQLARFTLDASANVLGNINDLFDGGVRQMVGPRGERGVASIDGVSNPGGDIDLVAGTGITITANQTNHKVTIASSGTSGLVSVDGVSSPGGNIDLEQKDAVQITANAEAKKITIGETHSAKTDNPHGTTAAQIDTVGGGLNRLVEQINSGNGVINGERIGTSIARVTALSEKGEFVVGAVTLGATGKSGPITVTQQNMFNKLVEIRGLASSKSNGAPGITTGGQKWSPLPATSREGWVLVLSSEFEFPDFISFTEETRLIKVGFKFGAGVTFWIEAPPGTTVGYGFKVSWGLKPSS